MSKLTLPPKGEAKPVTPTASTPPEKFTIKHSWLCESVQIEDAMEDYCKTMRRQYGIRMTKQELITIAVTQLLKNKGFL